MPAEEGQDPRWRAIISVVGFVESDPEQVWAFVRRWGFHPQEELRDAIATCLLEPLLKYHFAAYFPQVQQLALADPLLADTFRRCWQFGQALRPGNAEQFVALADQFV